MKNQMDKKRICLVDDHQIILEGVASILDPIEDIQVVNKYRHLPDFFKDLCLNTWDLVVLDVSFPGTSGLEGLYQLRQLNSQIPVLMFTMYDEQQFGVQALRAGANGYLCKDRASTDLITAIRQIHSGQKYISKTVSELLADTDFGDNRNLHQALSEREFQVFTMLGNGKSLTHISEVLKISIKTVSTYRRRILDKMDFETNSDIVCYCLNNGLRY